MFQRIAVVFGSGRTLKRALYVRGAAGQRVEVLPRQAQEQASEEGNG